MPRADCPCRWCALTDKKPGRPKKRKQGGQPGHDRHLRKPFAEDELDGHWIWHYDECPCCGGHLIADDQPAVVLQQVELLALPLEINQHDRHHQRCTKCKKSFLPARPN